MKLFQKSHTEAEFLDVYEKWENANKEVATMRRTWLSPEDTQKLANHRDRLLAELRKMVGLRDIEEKFRKLEQRHTGITDVLSRWQRKAKTVQMQLDALQKVLVSMCRKREKADEQLAEISAICAPDDLGMIIFEKVREGKHQINVLLPLPPDMPFHKVWEFVCEEKAMLGISDRYAPMSAEKKGGGIWVGVYERNWFKNDSGL